MERSIAVVLAATVLFGVHAKPVVGADVKWWPSVEAGVNLSRWHPTGPFPEALYGSMSDPYETFTGFYAGGSVSIPFRTFAVRTGLTFSRRGTEIPADPETIRADYIDVPLLIEWRSPAAHGVQPVVLAGPVLSRRLSTKSSQAPDGGGDAVKSLDAGVVLGGALEVRRVAVELKYTWGLVPLQGTSSFFPSVYNRCWSAGLRVVVSHAASRSVGSFLPDYLAGGLGEKVAECGTRFAGERGGDVIVRAAGAPVFDEGRAM